jgi:hypothetical protein
MEWIPLLLAKTEGPKLGIYSWSVPWSIGVQGNPRPERPLGCIGLLAKAFGAVVAADGFRLAAGGDDGIQHSRHSPAGKAGVYFQPQALAREGIDYTEHPDRAPGRNHVVNEIQRPLLVPGSPLSSADATSRRARSACASYASSRVLLAVHTIRAVMVHPLSLTFHQHLQSTVAIPRPFSAQPQ